MLRWSPVLIVTAAPLLFGSGCKKAEPEKVPPAAEASAKPASPEPMSKPATADKPTADAEQLPKTQVTDGIPTEEDYEEEASEVITAENLEAELDKLETEIRAN